jgi:VanZ family protein
MLHADDWFDAPVARRARRAWRIALVAYLVPIMVATHWPHLTAVGSGTVDKFIHFVGFGALAWIFLHAAPFRRPILNLALGIFWVYFDEVTQSIKILGRTFSVYDMTAGWLGCIVAGLVWWAIRLRARRDTDERLDDLAAERVLFASGREWAIAACTTALVGLVAGYPLFAEQAADVPLIGRLVYPVGVGGLAGAVVATVHGYLRGFARTAQGGVDAWDGAAAGTHGGGAAISPRAVWIPIASALAVGAALRWPAGYLFDLGTLLLFGREPGDLQVDFDGFVVLRPTFVTMLAFAGAVAWISVLARVRRGARGFHPPRPRP